MELPNNQEFIDLMHQALDNYEILVWNGQPEPIKKNLGSAITSLSYDVKELKTDIKNIKNDITFQSDLLSGFKARRNIVQNLRNLLSSVKTGFGIGLILKIIGGCGAIYAAYNIVFSLINLFKK